ncbi:MAG: cytochrome c maturation protein CcmE [Terrabacter sp.]
MSTLPHAAPPQAGRAPRLRLLVCLGVIVAALGWVSVRGLTGSLVYYLAPTDVVTRHQAEPGQRVRLGGYVVPGTVHRTGAALTFTVTDGTESLTVVDTGPVPALFRDGQGVVLEGELGSDHTFHSDTLLVKHNGEYQPPAPGQRPPGTAELDEAG